MAAPAVLAHTQTKLNRLPLARRTLMLVGRLSFWSVFMLPARFMGACLKLPHHVRRSFSAPDLRAVRYYCYRRPEWLLEL